MLREKPANEQAVTKLIDYLNDLWLICKSDQKLEFSSTKVQEYHGVAKRTFSDCKALGLVNMEEGRPKWLKSEPGRNIALKILDYRLKKNKKSIHVPIPEFAALGETLKTIAERLAHITIQYEKSLKRDKIEISGQDADLFKVEDQRLYIAGQIASGVYAKMNFCQHEFENYPGLSADNMVNGEKNYHAISSISKCRLCGIEPNIMVQDNNFEAANDIIVSATDDLMNKLLRGNIKSN